MIDNKFPLDLNADPNCEANICDLLDRIALLEATVDNQSKDILTSEEASKYLDITQKYLYKLNCENIITYSRPKGGKCYYKKDDLNDWMLSSKRKSIKQLETELK